MTHAVPATVGRFRILDELGRGGMGVVYRALDQTSGEEVALKVVVGDHARDSKAMSRFRREARATMAIAHPNVVRTIDTGEDGGVPWMACELCPGGSARDLMKRRGTLPWPEAARLVAAVARGLGAAHSLGLVHRDVKPGNVLFDAQGTPRISDFGIVRGALATGASIAALTKTGDVLGTPYYMSPEQLSGEKTIDGRADLYSLGAMLVELLTGSPPFVGTSVEVAKHHFADPPPMPSARGIEVPEPLEALLARLLAKEPGDRPSKAEDVALALDAIGAGGGASSRGPIAIVAGVIVLATAVGLAIASRVAASPAPPAPAPASVATGVASAAVPPPPKPGAWLAELRKSGDAPATIPPCLEAGVEKGEYLHRASGIVFVYVASGPFQMGDDAGGQRGCGEESPAHLVDLSEFWIGELEVTNEQFARFARERKYKTIAEDIGRASFVTPKDPMEGETTIVGASFRAPFGPDGPKTDAFPRHPVVQIAYQDAAAFCDWASRELSSGWVIELPRETQWEKAARWSRAQKRSFVFPWGDEPAPANRRLPTPGPGLGAADLEKAIHGPLLTHEVGLFDDASPCGARDMAGNVFEWVQDGYVAELYTQRAGKEPPVKDPEPIVMETETILRGGSFNSPVELLRASRRDRRNIRRFAASDVGFRVVLRRR